MRSRTVPISGLSKTFSCTGWRLGYAIAPFEFTSPIRKVHDFLTVGAPAPLQAAGAIGLAFDSDYYNHLALEYRARRDIMCSALDEAGFKYAAPEGAYYILADFSEISDLESREFAIWLAKEAGVATVPGMGYTLAELAVCERFAFARKSSWGRRRKGGDLAGRGVTPQRSFHSQSAVMRASSPARARPAPDHRLRRQCRAQNAIARVPRKWRTGFRNSALIADSSTARGTRKGS